MVVAGPLPGAAKAWDDLGKDIANVASDIGTVNAFVPSYLPASDVDLLMGKDLIL